MITRNRNGGVPHRLYRNKRDGILFGVCAGIADFMNVSRLGVRLIFIISLFFFFPFTVMAYLVLAVFMKRMPDEPAVRDPNEAQFWQSVTLEPGDTLRALRHRFRRLDGRLAHLEREITSKDYDLRRQFRDLERSERGQPGP